jgi:subtilisin family serine protease
MLRPLSRARRALSGVAAALAAFEAIAMLLAGPAHADLVRSTESWVISELNLQPVWASGDEGHGVVVAVIDSGVDPDVSDLTGSVRTGPNDSGVNTPQSDPNWGLHGTWMASLVAGHGHGDGDGILGSAPASTVLSIRVITDSTDPDYAQYERESASRGQRELAEAITYAVGHGAGVISMSLGYSLQSRVVRAALQDAYDHDVVVVASAGNSGNSPVTASSGHAPYSFPADYPGVLAVAAVNSSGSVSGFSSKNLSVQVAAPGVRVPAQGRNGGYWLVTGTSPACALTAGVVALIKSRYPRLSDAQVIAAMTSSTTASTRPAGGWDAEVGFGVVNAAGALAAAGQLAKAGPPPAGVASSSHFGGGIAAIPPPPVAPRGPAGLILYCLLAAGCLTVIGLATGRLFALRDARAAAAGSPAWPPAGHPDPGDAQPRSGYGWPESPGATGQGPDDGPGELPPHAHFLPAPPAWPVLPPAARPDPGLPGDS